MLDRVEEEEEVVVVVVGGGQWEEDSLAELLALVRRQLGRAGAHDGIRRRDVDLLGPVRKRDC